MEHPLLQDFFDAVEDNNRDFVKEMHTELTAYGCTIQIKAAKSGYVVSYRKPDGQMLANYVFRKSGVQLRIYGAVLCANTDLLQSLPKKMKQKMEKAMICKRLSHTGECNPRCPMGYTFILDGEQHRKCRNSAFFFPLNEENHIYLKQLLLCELAV